MIVVDSSVWIAYFKNQPRQFAELFTEIIDSGDDIVIIPIILSEILSGFKSDLDFNKALKVMELIPIIPVSNKDHIEAAKLFRHLRKNGLTIRGVVDCLIAHMCINTQSMLLTVDKDFTQIAKHSSLKLVEV